MTKKSYASGSKVAQHLELTSGESISDERIQPNGVDVGIDDIYRVSGTATFKNGTYTKPDRMKMAHRRATNGSLQWSLVQGPYILKYDVKFEIPDGYVGRMYPRSRVMRSGLHLTSALWDQGYHGVGEGLLQVPQSIQRVKIGSTEKLAQFTLIEADAPEASYDGTHQGKGVEMSVPSENALDEMRKDRGISAKTMSECCGASPRSWGNAVRKGVMSNSFKRNALKVFDYYDEYGYVPRPDEVELEELHPGKNSS
jgi:dUTP pyrophosphatase